MLLQFENVCALSCSLSTDEEGSDSEERRNKKKVVEVVEEDDDDDEEEMERKLAELKAEEVAELKR